jgi:hypothetical protein
LAFPEASGRLLPSNLPFGAGGVNRNLGRPRLAGETLPPLRPPEVSEGRLWVHEMGPRGGDELNLIEKGVN